MILLQVKYLINTNLKTTKNNKIIIAMDYLISIRTYLQGV